MFAVIRLRGSSDLRKEVKDTLRMLNLKKVNNCVLLPEKEEYFGMLRKAKDCITWGRINRKTLVRLLKERGRFLKDKKLDEKILKEVTGFKSFEEFADALIREKVRLKDFKQIKKVFRLNPPRHGFKSVRLPYPKGDLGNREEKINELIERMI